MYGNVVLQHRTKVEKNYERARSTPPKLENPHTEWAAKLAFLGAFPEFWVVGTRLRIVFLKDFTSESLLNYFRRQYSTLALCRYCRVWKIWKIPKMGCTARQTRATSPGGVRSRPRALRARRSHFLEFPDFPYCTVLYFDGFSSDSTADDSSGHWDTARQMRAC